jgi:hypothetical protein
VSTKNYGFCSKGGAHSWWWLRSPCADDPVSFHGVYDDGEWDWEDNANRGWGVSPGFCF